MFGHNKGLGLLSQGSGGGSPMSQRQLSLVASEGFSGNGMATIGVDNTFSVIAHMPPPHTFSPYPSVYAAYLVDGKGKSGFYAGTLRPAGNGMYQASFRSPVPLIHYNRVVVSLESPQSIMQTPQGPIVMKVKEGLFDSLGPVKKAGGNMWGKVKGFVGGRFGGKGENIPEQPAVQQPPAIPQQNIPQYTGQQGHPPGGYPQQPGYYQQRGYQQGYQPRDYRQPRVQPRGYQQGVPGNQAVYQGGYQGGYQQGNFLGSNQGGGGYRQPLYYQPAAPAAPPAEPAAPVAPNNIPNMAVVQDTAAITNQPLPVQQVTVSDVPTEQH